MTKSSVTLCIVTFTPTAQPLAILHPHQAFPEQPHCSSLHPRRVLLRSSLPALTILNTAPSTSWAPYLRK